MSDSQKSALEAIPDPKQMRRIDFFHAANAQDLHASGVMKSGSAPPEREPFNSVFAQAIQEGVVSRVLFRGADGFSLIYAWFKSGFPLPAHSHDSDCLYYVVAGELHYGTQILKPGDGFFVPANTVYAYRAGPLGVEVLEFRSASEFDIQLLSVPLSAWERSATAIQARIEAWRNEAPPVRKSTGLG